MKQLIVNADDFGLAEGVNEGIIRSFREGIVTSTSIMANGESFEHAVSLSKQHSTLSVGIHLVLVEEKPVLSPHQVSSLVSKNGKLYRNYQEFLNWFVFGRVQIADVEKELRAQIEKVLKAGIVVDHIDSHQHLHVFPIILDMVLRLAEEYEIRRMRNPYENSIPTSIGKAGLAFLARTGKRKMLNSPIQTTDHFFGADFSGRLTESDLLNLLLKLPDGISELMCHPGEEDEKLLTKYRHWRFHWKQEQDALRLKAVRQSIAKNGIMLTNYSRL